ncbi:hypothetical protein DERF_005648 [Dermatophagoides farinae]|uniref:Uncharacterized protein n=1 Tax=Dermatophagoides farinae TaxID=6954 RepID=A0A922I8N5_DERFA|nr:hypothetical protein DERF_005648 [Dermatophagoides farinae]
MRKFEKPRIFLLQNATKQAKQNIKFLMSPFFLKNKPDNDNDGSFNLFFLDGGDSNSDGVGF